MIRPFKKITVEISEDLLEKAMNQTQTGLTDTIRQGLTLLAESSTYKKLKNFKGKGEFEFQWQDLKEDR
jgi:hypothetical protein